MALAESTHHAALRGPKKARAGGGVRDAVHGEVPEALFPQEPRELGGSRPDRLYEVRPQEWVLRHIVEQAGDVAPGLPALDALVPHVVDQFEVRPLDTVVPEQVIEASKIALHDVIPQRAVLLVPQMAEQLVDEPVPSFDDFELVEESDEEQEEQPQVVPRSRVRDAEVYAWCLVVGLAGVYWWRIGTSFAQWTPPRRRSPPGQGGIEILAAATMADVAVVCPFFVVSFQVKMAGGQPSAACDGAAMRATAPLMAET